jgi:Nucleotidyltransferase domain
MHCEAYPEMASVLQRFVAGVQDALRSNFIGAYLVGSLATGDFDLDSDVDFLILTKAELSDAEVRSLQTTHVDIHALGCYPAEHLEGSYISTDLLNRTDLVGVEPLWFLENGSASLERSIHDNRWHVRWILREQGITIIGPDPKTLLQPVPTGQKATAQEDSRTAVGAGRKNGKTPPFLVKRATTSAWGGRKRSSHRRATYPRETKALRSRSHSIG